MIRTLNLSHRSAGSKRPACFAVRAQAQQGFEKGLSGDVLAMFHEAQRNILELNKSRLMALDELRQAKERIQELEAVCARYEGTSGTSSTSSAASGSSAANKVTIAYSTGWKQAFLHYRRADGTWTELPGVQMPMDPQQPGLFVASLDQGDVEFVFNNGDADWDSPNGGNYAIDREGQYLVQGGSVSEL